MRSWSNLLAAVLLTTCAAAFPSGPDDTIHELSRRNIVYDGQIADSYDFVIIGGGTAGLTLASRLSEDSNTTVLVLEAGDTGDAVKNTVDIPGNTYYISLLGTTYDWDYKTVAQSGANSRTITWPAGKLLGGSSAINGMYNVRPSKDEVDMWASMIEGGDIWSWDNLFTAMKKGEDFTAPSADVQSAGAIQFAAESHGTTGPLHVSYPGFMVPIVGDWTETLANAGIPATADAYSGENWGGFIAASDINPTNWTRSYARSAYIDPLPPRPNLSILPNSTVTRILFTNSSSGNLTANAVEYAASRDAARFTVNVTREVILSAGTVGSPRVLMHSGVGPSDVLAAVDVPVVHALPGVGQHLQDHISTELVWKTDVETAASIHAANYSNYDDYDVSTPFLSFINSATCYANTSMLIGSSASSAFIANVASAIDTSASSLVPSTDPTVIAGYKAIYNATAQLLSTSVGQIEILLSLTGSGVGAESIAIQAALQHPFSQGSLWINSSDPFDPPVIDPKYLSHSADLEIFREGLKLVRTIGNTAPLNSALLSESSPGSSVQTDDDWDTWLAGQYSTEFHPSCSLSMLPLEQGGVVDANLKVYGLANVRVVDASVIPFAFSAHMMAPVYGLAEQAANIIRAQYNVVASTNTTNSSTSSGAPSPSSSGTSGTPSQQVTSKSGASLTRPDVALSLLTLVACALAAL